MEHVHGEVINDTGDTTQSLHRYSRSVQFTTVSLDSLPAEIFDRVFDHVCADGLDLNLAFVSKQLQHRVRSHAVVTAYQTLLVNDKEKSIVFGAATRCLTDNVGQDAARVLNTESTSNIDFTEMQKGSRVDDDTPARTNYKTDSFKQNTTRYIRDNIAYLHVLVIKTLIKRYCDQPLRKEGHAAFEVHFQDFWNRLADLGSHPPHFDDLRVWDSKFDPFGQHLNWRVRVWPPQGVVTVRGLHSRNPSLEVGKCIPILQRFMHSHGKENKTIAERHRKPPQLIHRYQ